MENVTNFPNGVSDRGVIRVRKRQSVTGKATIATGLGTCLGGIACLDKVESGAGKTWVVSAKASATPGAIDVVVKDSAGTESTTAVGVTVDADGTA